MYKSLKTKEVKISKGQTNWADSRNKIPFEKVDLGQQWAGWGRGWEGVISTFLVGKRSGWRWAATFSSSSSRCLLVFADRKTKRNGRQKEQEIDHEEIVEEEEAGKKGKR